MVEFCEYWKVDCLLSNFERYFGGFGWFCWLVGYVVNVKLEC